MTSDEQQVYYDLISDLRQASRDMNMLLIHIKRYESYIARGLIVNDTVTFEGNLAQMKDSLNYKMSKIRNEIIPDLYDILNSN